LGRGTVESIQSGLFHGNIGAIKEICGNITEEVFKGQRPYIIGTGGFASLFSEVSREKNPLFDEEIPDLVLYGIHQAFQLNQKF
jgi:type III pantothenate kinase